MIRTIIASALVATLAACGGSEQPEECRVFRAAWIAGPTDTLLTGPEHSALTDDELHAVGVIHAKRAGLDASRVEVGGWADCND